MKNENKLEYFKCDCGAITIIMRDRTEYSCEQKNFKKFFPKLDLRRMNRYPTTYSCNHCVNHYGLDLCGCGSGEPFGDCLNDLPECKYPMQMLGKYSRVIAEDALIA